MKEIDLIPDIEKIKTIGDLKKSGYKDISVKDELRQNLIAKLKENEEIFHNIVGYDETVIPEIQNAILSKHDFILLGLRGQAKTKILRNLVNLLDPYMPVIAGSDINDHPYHPISLASRQMVEKLGDDTPIEWIPQGERYNEKLATPDVSIADLFGDIDPIKAATQKLHYAHEGAIHYGIIPRTNRGIFVINELPDLQPRIQVGLLNVLEEEDLQIRGYPVRIPLDIVIAFSANPEDYTNRGNIITPLKDRIDSQIITHYPLNISYGVEITNQEAWHAREEFDNYDIPYYFREIIEYIAIEARASELIDQKSGVSARLPISCLENLVGNAERRALLNKSKKYHVRISDLQALIPAITGKIELVYEGEQEGVINVAKLLIGKALKRTFDRYFPQPKAKQADGKESNEYDKILEWFNQENMIAIDSNGNDENYTRSIKSVAPVESLVRKYFPNDQLQDEMSMTVAKEFVLEALHQHSFLSKFETDGKVTYKDLMDSIFNSLPEDSDAEDDYYA
jgi:magnesium chelatase subunit I